LIGDFFLAPDPLILKDMYQVNGDYLGVGLH
jgi:hypothetical protein